MISGSFLDGEYPVETLTVEGVRLPIGKDNAIVAAVYESTPAPESDFMPGDGIYEIVNQTPPAAYYVASRNHFAIKTVPEISIGTVFGVILRLSSADYIERMDRSEENPASYRRRGPSGFVFVGAAALLPITSQRLGWQEI